MSIESLRVKAFKAPVLRGFLFNEGLALVMQVAFLIYLLGFFNLLVFYTYNSLQYVENLLIMKNIT